MQKIKPANNATNLTAKPQNLNGNDNDNVNDNVNANENVKGDVYKKGGVGKKEVAGNGDRPTKIVCRKRKMQCRRTRMHEHLFLRNLLHNRKLWCIIV